MYITSRYEATVQIPEYLERFVDIPTFLPACQKCRNYEKVWSCPPYDFDVESYWKQFQTFDLLAVKIVFDEEYRKRTYEPQELRKLTEAVFKKEKQKLTDELLEREKQYPGSVSLSAGSCSQCGAVCPRAEGKPCLFPETMRYSIESLGGNVGLTIEKLMGLRLEWMEEDRLPSHFILVCGLLRP